MMAGGDRARFVRHSPFVCSITVGPAPLSGCARDPEGAILRKRLLHKGWWTRSQRIRTAAELPFEAVLADATAAPVYQRIASKALHLQQLGLGPSAIARRIGTDRKMVTKSLAWLARPRQA